MLAYYGGDEEKGKGSATAQAPSEVGGKLDPEGGSLFGSYLNLVANQLVKFLKTRLVAVEFVGGVESPLSLSMDPKNFLRFKLHSSHETRIACQRLGHSMAQERSESES
jgi:hypothetical protein